MDPLERAASTTPASGLRLVTQEAHDLAQRLVREQKQRWASEIHDGLTQTVTAAVLELERLHERLATDPKEAEATLDSTVAELRAALADVREALFELNGDAEEIDDDETASESLRATVDEVAARFDMQVDVSLDGPIDPLPPNTVAVAGLVIREALTNVAKHSGTQVATVRARGGRDGITVEIEDHGHGSQTASGDHHFGMRMMRRRVDEAGGIMAVRSNEAGTTLLAHIPSRMGSIR